VTEIDVHSLLVDVAGDATLDAVETELAARGIDVAVLESDALRQVFTEHPRYDEAERDAFYRQMAYVGTLLVQHGVPVIFDATANRRQYRERARHLIDRFLEVYVDCPLETCMARDPKGIYRRGREGFADSVPGLQSVYEAPEAPDLVVRGGEESPEAAARRVIARLIERGYLCESSRTQ
jgi:adenylylsulfate kinase